MVSIIVCTYNDSKYLPRALNSCLLQNIEKEIILVDDCSTIPISNEVMDIVYSNKIKLICHDKNRGLSAARNTGIEASSYELVIPLDADDFLFPRSLSGLLSHYTNTHDIFYGLMTCSGMLVRPYIEEITKKVLMGNNPIFSSSLFKKKLWEKVGGYKVREGAHYEDWNFWCRSFLAGGKFRFVPVLVYEHTERSDSMLRTLAKDKDLYIKIATEELIGS